MYAINLYHILPFVKKHPQCIVTLLFVQDNKKGGVNLRKDEKKPLSWEVADPKPPVIQSGHMEGRKQNDR
jgi:hypothetical protein